MPERARTDGWNDTGHICAISSTYSSCPTLSQQPIFSSSSLKMTRVYPSTFLNLIISKLRDIRGGGIQMKVSSVMGNDCVQTFPSQP